MNKRQAKKIYRKYYYWKVIEDFQLSGFTDGCKVSYLTSSNNRWDKELTRKRVGLLGAFHKNSRFVYRIMNPITGIIIP